MVVLLALGFTFFCWFVNALFLQYERTAVQAALMDGARQGVRITPFDEDSCVATAQAALRSTVRGVTEDGQVSDIKCMYTEPAGGAPGKVTVTATVRLKTVFPAPAAVSPIDPDATLTATMQRRAPGGGS
jgi:hypothetical protein